MKQFHLLPTPHSHTPLSFVGKKRTSGEKKSPDREKQEEKQH